MNNNTINIEINGTPYPVKYGYGAIKILGRYLQTDGYDVTVKEVSALLATLAAAEKSGGGIPFSVTDALGYLLKAGLEYADPDNDLPLDDVTEFVLQNPDTLKPVFELFSESMPKPKAPEKKTRAKK